MASLNKVQLIGNVGRDPEIRYLPSGDPVANVTLATSERYKDKAGEKQERTEWHRLVFFGKLAEIVEKYVTKGNPIYVEGQIRTSEYEKNGEKRYSTEIVVREMQLLGGRKEDAPAKPEAPKKVTFDDLDVPF